MIVEVRVACIGNEFEVSHIANEAINYAAKKFKHEYHIYGPQIIRNADKKPLTLIYRVSNLGKNEGADIWAMEPDSLVAGNSFEQKGKRRGR